MTDVETRDPPRLLRRIIAYPLTLAVLGSVWLLVWYAVAAIGTQKAVPPNHPAKPLLALAGAVLGLLAYLVQALDRTRTGN